MKYFYIQIIGSIKVAYYTHSIKYGGIERVVALLINMLSKEKYLKIYLITHTKKLKEEYKIENDYLFKKWGINSILMDNPTTFEYDTVIPSDLSNNNIIMIGRIEDPVKRFELGIRAMKIIIKEFPDCTMKIISSNKKKKFKKLISHLHLNKNVKFTGVKKNVEMYLKNASLHILPSISECYPMVLGETKIFGIPSIIC